MKIAAKLFICTLVIFVASLGVGADTVPTARQLQAENIFLIDPIQCAVLLTEILTDENRFYQAVSTIVSSSNIRVHHLDRIRHHLKAFPNNSRKNAAYTQLAEGYASLGYFDIAIRVIENIPDTSIQASPLVGVAGKAARIGNFDSAVIIAELIQLPNAKSLALSWLARAYMNSGLIDTALVIINAVPEHSDKTRLLAEISKKYAHAGHLEKAAVLFSKALNSATELKDPLTRANVLSFDLLTDTFIRSDHLAKATQVALGIDDQNYRSLPFTLIADRYLIAGETNSAIFALDQAQAAAQDITEEFTRPGILATVAHYYIRVGQPNEAEQMISMIETESWNSEALTQLATSFLEAGYVDTAFIIATALSSPLHKTILLGQVGQAFSAKGEDEVALKCWDFANKSAQKIDEESVKISALVNLVESIAKTSNKKLAVKYLDDALEICAAMEDFSDLDATVSVILNCSAVSKKHFDKVIQIAKKIPEGQKTQYYKARILGQVFRSDYAREKDYDHVFKIGKSLKGNSAWLDELIGLAEFYEKIDRRDKGVTTLAYTAKRAEALYEERILLRTAAGFVRLKHDKKAAAVLMKAQITIEKQNRPEWAKDRNYKDVAKLYARLGRSDDALMTVLKIKNPNEQIIALIAITDETPDRAFSLSKEEKDILRQIMASNL